MGVTLPLAALAESLISAGAGLLGVVVGAGLAVVAEERRKRGDTRSAARLVDAELADTFAKVEPSVGPRAQPSRALAAELETPAWLESRSALALALAPDEWGRVRDAFASIAAYRAALAGDGSVERQGRAALEAIRSARTTLERF